MIDQTRGFQEIYALLKPEGLTHVRRQTWERLRDAVRRFLTAGELKALEARWKLLIEHFEELLDERGEELVVY